MPSSAHPNDTSAGALASVEAACLVQDSGFKASARLKKLLVYLCDRAEKPLDPPVTQVEIAKEVLGLNKDFDPVSDAHVRIEIAGYVRHLRFITRNQHPIQIFRSRLPRAAMSQSWNVFRRARHPFP